MGESRDVGILFVHGIGEQQRGDTLTLWGDAVIDWLQRWLGEDEVVVQAVHLGEDQDDPDAPAYLDLQATFAGQPATWRLAEAWWAQAYAPPRFRELAFWAFGVLPYALMAHFISRLQRAWASRRPGALSRLKWAASIGARLLEVFLSILLSPLLAPIVLVVLLLGAMPIARLRQIADALQRMLSRSVGDSFVLLGSPTRRGAIAHRVEHDLRWLNAGCAQLVVVAHSQGAAIAHHALRLVKPAGLRRFVTLGSGQTKLAALEGLRHSPAGQMVWLAPAGLVVVAISVVLTVERLQQGIEDPFTPLWFAGSFGVLFAIYGAIQARSMTPPDAAALDPGASDGWVDLYASHDPVSNGPLYGGLADPPALESRRVSNLGSSWRDHTAYAGNAEQVITEIVESAASGRALDNLDQFGLAARRVAAVRRDWRVRWLRALRTGTAATSVVVLVLAADRLATVGQQVLAAAASVLGLIPFVNLEVVSVVPSELSPGVGALVVVGAASVAYLALAGVWRLWDRAEQRRMFRREQYPVWPPHLVVLMWSAVSMAALAVFAAGPFRRPLYFDEVPLMLVVLPVFFAFMATVITAVLTPVALLLRKVGRIRPGHYPPRPAYILSVLAPAAIVVAAITLLTPPGQPANPALFLGLLFGAPALAALGPAVLSSSRAVHRMMLPVRRWAHAEPLSVAARPLLGPAATAALETEAKTLTAGLLKAQQGGKTDVDRALDDLCVQAMDVGQALVAAGRLDAAASLLTAVAPLSPDTAADLGKLPPDQERRHTGAGSRRPGPARDHAGQRLSPQDNAGSRPLAP